MVHITKLLLNLILFLVLFSTSIRTFASEQQIPSILIPRQRRFIHFHQEPPPAMVPAFGESQLFGSAVKKHASGDLEGAIAGYLAAIKVHDNDPTVHWYLGTAYRAAGKELDARREFEKEHEIKRTSDGALRKFKSSSNSGVSILPAGDFGSNELLFVPGEGLSKSSEQ